MERAKQPLSQSEVERTTQVHINLVESFLWYFLQSEGERAIYNNGILKRDSRL